MKVCADDVAPTPWKNAGGLSRDLLVWPAGGGWRVRVSLADITAPGPFSAYPGVQRWFAVVAGAGVVLALPGAEHLQRCGDAPVCFDGAAAPSCRLLDGPTVALNLMLHGGRGEMCASIPGAPWATAWHTRGRYDIDTRTLHWGLPHGPLRTDVPALWLGADL